VDTARSSHIGAGSAAGVVGSAREHPGPSTQRRIRARGAILRRVTLDIDHVTKRFAATLALDDLAFSVPRGRIFGFLGANGAGKTTTMRICLGILQADSGEVRWDGTPTTALPRRTWGYLPEERGLYPRMGVLDQLVYFATLYGQPADVARREARHWLTRFRIPEYAERRAEELSKGNQQKVQFIAAILHGPEVLLMDEPFTGLDPVNLALLREAFVEQRDAGRTIVFSTHQMEAAEALCESLAIVDQGRVVAGGTLAELKRTSRSRTVRLGIEGETMPIWLGAVPGVIAVRPGAGFAEVELSAGIEPSAVLAAAVARGADVTRFEVAEPSLEAIFIEKVGRSAEDEATLADDASTPDTTGVPESIVEGAV
jgi:ABC-2 type transport system ATP-binding protein